MSDLVILQGEFARALSKLIINAYSQGWVVTLAWSYRSPEVNNLIGGHPRSTHVYRLAQDLNLFINGVYQRDSESHRPLGEYWKTLHPLARWGGDFTRPDGNHYSFEWQGVQ